MLTPPSPTVTALVALMKLKGVGRRGALRVVEAVAADTDPDIFRRMILSSAGRARLDENALADAWAVSEAQLKESQDAGIEAFSLHDADYPARLKNIPDPPAVLYVKGRRAGLGQGSALAVVGTREPTDYGAKVARKSAATAVEVGFVIVSGLAHGCDTFGHEGCLDVGGVGVAVLAHGLDKVYPASNRGLAARLLENGGCLVSEYPLGFTPMRTAFAERDRIQSGLSDGVLVIETDIKGGTMHTVRFSREQGRALACVDHPEKLHNEEKTRGNRQLIADKWATPIPDGGALMRFLEDLRVREAAVSAPLPAVGQQTTMAF